MIWLDAWKFLHQERISLPQSSLTEDVYCVFPQLFPLSSLYHYILYFYCIPVFSLLLAISTTFHYLHLLYTHGGIDEQHSLPRPRFQIAVIRCSEGCWVIAAQFLVDVLQGAWYRHTRGHRERQTMRLKTDSLRVLIHRKDQFSIHIFCTFKWFGFWFYTSIIFFVLVYHYKSPSSIYNHYI